ncbi:hypothetical protein L1887_38995 [Cichorium endivia]|nr:hypothetical protein L1887_38995 [Cichorium endivia]
MTLFLTECFHGALKFHLKLHVFKNEKERSNVEVAFGKAVKEKNQRFTCGVIRADNQGLGKTISVIAIILRERPPSSSTVCATKTKEKQTETLNLDEGEDVIRIPTTQNVVYGEGNLLYALQVSSVNAKNPISLF